MEKGKSIERWRRKDTDLKVNTYDGWFTLVIFLKQWVKLTVFFSIWIHLKILDLGVEI